MNTQPEALRLATILQTSGWQPTQQEFLEAAAELRRLHEANQMLMEAAEMALAAMEAKGDLWIALERKAKEALRQALAQSGQGYALIHKDVLRAWGKLDEIESACCYPVSKEKEIAGLREAIWEAIKNWDINTPEYSGYCSANGSHVETIFNAVKALAQPEQKPVAGKGKEFSEQLKLCARNVAFVSSGQVDMSSAAMQEMFALIDHVCVGLDSPPALAQPEQEPVAIVNEGMGGIEWLSKPLPDDTPLYTAPPTMPDDLIATYEKGFRDGQAKREWVGLTDADKQEACIHMQKAKGGFWEFADYLDAKLKEKNT